MKKLLAIGYCLFAINCSAQVPADSLTGTYVGESYYKSPNSNPWTITNDTTYVTYIDSINCKVNMINHFGSWGGTRLYTKYYSCDTIIPPNYTTPPSTYWYTQFYSGDSLVIADINIPQASPNPSYYYYFYGKRIKHYNATGIKSIEKQRFIFVSPNPATEYITINNIDMQNKEIIITDILENILEKKRTDTNTINVNNLPNGIYFIEINTGINNYKIKFIKQ